MSGVVVPGDDGVVVVPGEAGGVAVPGAAGGVAVPGAAGVAGDGVPGDGVPGVVGDAGEVGVPGVVGDAGETGEVGVPGVVGDAGEVGEVGVPGVVGDAGEVGEVGVPGVVGDAGEVGEVCASAGLTRSPSPWHAPINTTAPSAASIALRPGRRSFILMICNVVGASASSSKAPGKALRVPGSRPRAWLHSARAGSPGRGRSCIDSMLVTSTPASALFECGTGLRSAKKSVCRRDSNPPSCLPGWCR